MRKIGTLDNWFISFGYEHSGLITVFYRTKDKKRTFLFHLFPVRQLWWRTNQLKIVEKLAGGRLFCFGPLLMFGFSE